MRLVVRVQVLLFVLAISCPARVAGGGPGSPGPSDAARLARLIDQHISVQLDAKGLQSAGPASDAQFLRRLYLDLHGVIPPVDRVSAFLDDTDPQKRIKVIDALLADAGYGRNLGDIWFRWLVPARQGKDRSPHHLFKAWLEASFTANKPWNQMSYEILTATAASREAVPDNPATTWLMVDSTKTLQANDATDLVCQVFLGIRMNCAQCHNHPFVGLKRKDYWGMAAFFTQISRRPGFGLIETADVRLQTKLPESAQVVPARFLGGAQPKLETGKPFRPVLAQWLTARDNPYFARAKVNRIWAHLFGRGIVHPFDDMHEENPPSHPKLLQSLTDEFVASGYDVKHLIRAICQSDAYQRSSWPRDQKASDPEWLAHRPIRVLTPWQLFDSLQRLALVPAESKGKKDLRREFVKFFDSDGEPNPFAYERGIPQALRLMNATRHETLLSQVVAQQTPARVIERMYLTILGRRPASAETERMLAHVQRAGGDLRQGYSDVLWVLLQSSEFTTNQ
jgi:hypothetical protein